MTERMKYYGRTRKSLRELGIPVHRMGYKVLCEAIPRYAVNDRQMLSKELYPALAETFGFTNGCAVERSVRSSIASAWGHRDPAVWDSYFPNSHRAPTNLIFIATLANRMKES